jgi:hypothetical protein
MGRPTPVAILTKFIYTFVMRKLLAVPLFLLPLGCPPGSGYHVNLTVTVPLDVQAKLSSAYPANLGG